MLVLGTCELAKSNVAALKEVLDCYCLQVTLVLTQGPAGEPVATARERVVASPMAAALREELERREQVLVAIAKTSWRGGLGRGLSNFYTLIAGFYVFMLFFVFVIFINVQSEGAQGNWVVIGASAVLFTLFTIPFVIVLPLTAMAAQAQQYYKIIWCRDESEPSMALLALNRKPCPNPNPGPSSQPNLPRAGCL